MDDEGAATGVGQALLTMAVFGAVISYFMQMLSFIILRRKLPNIERPYGARSGSPERRSPGSSRSSRSFRSTSTKRIGRVSSGTAIWFVLGLVYFAVTGRNKLVLSPEEEFALTSGEKGHPESEGYGTTHVDRRDEFVTLRASARESERRASSPPLAFDRPWGPDIR